MANTPINFKDPLLMTAWLDAAMGRAEPNAHGWRRCSRRSARGTRAIRTEAVQGRVGSCRRADVARDMAAEPRKARKSAAVWVYLSVVGWLAPSGLNAERKLARMAESASIHQAGGKEHRGGWAADGQGSEGKRGPRQ